MKRIPLMLFCVSIALASCKKENIQPTTEISEPSTLGSQMLGTWSSDSVSMIRTVDNHLWYTNSYVDSNFYRNIKYVSDKTYSETNFGTQSSATTNFELDDATQSYALKANNGTLGFRFYIIYIDEHRMVIDSYPNTASTRRDYLSR